MAVKEEPARILVVDDEGAIRYSVTKTLQRVGYDVEAVASGEDAIQKLQDEAFDVVLTDIRMPGISGVELLAQIRELHPDTSVILMTGYASLNTAVESLRLGAHDYLVKPSSSRDIRESVERGVERAQGMQRRRRLLNMIQSSIEELSEDEAEALSEAKPNADALPDDMAQNQSHIPFGVKSRGRVNMGPTISDQISPNVTAMELGPLTLYPGRYQIGVENDIIDLTPTEFDLLLYLAAHRGRVVPCNELVREVRGYSVDEAEAREVIRPHVSNLRRKIKLSSDNVDLIVNVRGVGYRLADVDRG